MANLTTGQKAQLDFIQQNFRRLRSICEWSASDVAEVLGVTRQTVNNLEMGKTQLTPLQYIGFASMLEHCRKSRRDVAAYLNICLAHFPGSEQGAAGDLLSSWFSFFPKQFPKAEVPGNAFRNIQSFKLIEHIIESCKVIVTPDIFLGNRKCLEELGAAALQYNNPLIVPAKALALIESSLSEDCRAFVDSCRRDGRIKLYGDEQDPPLAEVITMQMLRLRSKYSLCLVTNDRTLASDVQTLGSLQSVSGYDIITARIVGGTYLQLWDAGEGKWDEFLTGENSYQDGEGNDRSEDVHMEGCISVQEMSDGATSQDHMKTDGQSGAKSQSCAAGARETDDSWSML